MARFLLRPKWLMFTALIALLVVVMVNLGFWQLRRLDERQTFNSSVRARSEEPVVTLETLVTPDSDPGELQYRRVTAAGEYLADEEVLVVNRSQGGVAGRNAVTPLQLDDGTVVLVNRGFVPDTVDVPPPPAGRVELSGRLRASEERRLGQLTESDDGELREFQRLDIDRIAQQLPGEVLPVSIALTTSDPAQGELPAPVADPELSEGPHLSYAIQWLIFSICAIVGWFFAVRRSFNASLSAAVSATNERTASASPTPGDVEVPTAPG